LHGLLATFSLAVAILLLFFILKLKL
jgi:hypothetical protein